MFIYKKGKRLKKARGMSANSVQIDIISDLHLDFYIGRDNISIDINSFIRRFREDMEYKTDEVIIVAGDISRYNELSKELLSQLSTIWEYVLVVPGNHDWDLQDKYKDNRYADLIVSLEEEDNIKFLMDKIDIFKHKGVRIAGTIMFYNLRELKDYAMWKSLFTEHKYMTRQFIQSRNDRDIEYYNRVIDDVDIFVSHVPIVNLDGRSTTKNLFLNMDVTPKKGVLYLSGHTHKRRNSVDLMSEFDAMNISYGYPSEITDRRKVLTTIFTEGF